MLFSLVGDAEEITNARAPRFNFIAVEVPAS